MFQGRPLLPPTKPLPPSRPLPPLASKPVRAYVLLYHQTPSDINTIQCTFNCSLYALIGNKVKTPSSASCETHWDAASIHSTSGVLRFYCFAFSSSHINYKNTFNYLKNDIVNANLFKMLDSLVVWINVCVLKALLHSL